MKAWYLSYNRFEKRILKKWNKKGFNYNAGNVQILRYAYDTLMFWSVLKEKKVSKKNSPIGHPKLF